MPKFKPFLGAILLALALALVVTPAMAEDGSEASEEVELTAQAAKPTWSGASRIPVGAFAEYDVTSGINYGDLQAKTSKGWSYEGNGYVTFLKKGDGMTVVAKKAGTTTIRLVDNKGRQVETKQLTIYSIEGKDYEIQTSIKGKSNYVLDIRGKSTANSARMIVWPRNNGKNQRYRFERKADDGLYVCYGIKCVHSGKYVDVQGGGTKKSQPVIQYTWKNSSGDVWKANANQLWHLTVDAQNRVSFINYKSGMAFDIQGGKVTARAQMIQYPFNNGNNQKWVLNQK